MNPDVLIIGAGPAGMSAALSLQAAGAKVQVVDEQPAVGGQVYRAIERSARETDNRLSWLGNDYAKGRALAQEFRDASIELLHTTSVWDIACHDNRLEIGLVNSERAFYCHPLDGGRLGWW